MLIYEVYATALNCEGNYAGKKRLALFRDRENAEKYIQGWKRLWREHSTPGIPAYGMSPCHLDYEPEPTLSMAETED